MRKVLVVFIATILIAATAYSLYQQTKSDYESIFPRKLEDLTLVNYETGEKAIDNIKRLHRVGANIEVLEGYTAVYKGYGNNFVYVWVAEAATHDEAYRLLESMNVKIGYGDGFTRPKTLNLPAIKSPAVYYVEG